MHPNGYGWNGQTIDVKTSIIFLSGNDHPIIPSFFPLPNEIPCDDGKKVSRRLPAHSDAFAVKNRSHLRRLWFGDEICSFTPP